jgi:hypothetical protein
MANMLKHDDSCSFIGDVIGYVLAGYGARHPSSSFQLSFTWLSVLLQENQLFGFMTEPSPFLLHKLLVILVFFGIMNVLDSDWI